MLVLLSDLHLTDESTSSNVHPEAFSNVLFGEIKASVESKEATELHIVLLGDIFDLVRTDYWVMRYLDPLLLGAEELVAKRKAELPWNGTLNADTAMNDNTALMVTSYQDVLRRIFATETYKAFCELFRNLKALTESKKIPLQVTYLIGNHDRPLFNYDKVRDLLRSQFLADTGIALEYTRDPQENPGTKLCLSAYDVLIRHGHVWDDMCNGYQLYADVLHPHTKIDRCSITAHCVQAIGEVITAEFMAGLVCRVKNQLQATAHFERHQAFYRAVQEINNVRPSGKAFEWLIWLQAGCGDFEQGILISALNDSATAVLQTELFQRWKHTSFFKNVIVSFLEFLMKTGMKKDLPADIARGLFGKDGNDDVYAKNAAEEAAKYSVQYVVYGHTHNAISVYSSGEPNNRVRMYLNTGTYLPLVQKAETSGFASDYRMTLIFFYLSNEDNRDGNKKNGVSLEFWNGKKRKTYAA